jgi:transposase InsO family protein
VNNGTEFASRSLDHWAYWNKVHLDFSKPGKPPDRAFIESFNLSLRRECLSQHYVFDVADANLVWNNGETITATRASQWLRQCAADPLRGAEHFTPAWNQLENCRSPDRNLEDDHRPRDSLLE